MTRPDVQPVKRTNFPAKTKRLAKERSGGLCEVDRVPADLRKCWYAALPASCKRAGEDIDHITPDALGGSNDLQNAANLCKPCHKVKTVVDNKLAKKANRIRGKTGQQKRLKARGHSSIQGRGFQKTPENYKHNWGKRPMRG